MDTHCCQIFRILADTPEIQIHETSRFVTFGSHLYKYWLNQTGHSCGQHPAMILIYYQAKDTGRERLILESCELTWGFSASELRPRSV